MLRSILEFLRDKGISCQVEGNDKIKSSHSKSGTTIEIVGEIPPNFPKSDPNFLLNRRDAYAHLAHVAFDDKINMGKICGGEIESFSLNFERPENLYYELLLRIVDGVFKAIFDTEWNELEIRREYSAMWDQACDSDALPITCISTNPDKVIELVVKSPLKNKKIGIYQNFIAANQNDIGVNKESIFFETFNDKSRPIESKACLIPVENLPPPPLPSDNIKKWWWSLLQSIETDFSNELSLFGKNIRGKLFWIILVGPTPSGKTWVSIRCTSDKKSNVPLSLKYIDGWDFLAHSVDVINIDTVMSRSGGDVNLSGKKVAVIGCGSVGSVIAIQLARAGVGRLRLFDPDIYKHENLYRHELSSYAVNRFKSTSLAWQIKSDYPFCNAIGNHKISLLELAESEKLDNCDLVVVATGNPTQERYFNQLIFDREKGGISVIYAWVESYGYGGHAVYSDGKSGGCLECTYFDNANLEASLNCNLNFLAPNQILNKNMSGCGSLFLPYTGMDSSQTGLMASRLAVDVLLDRVTESTKISWIGGDGNDTRELIKTTHRFSKFSNQLKYLPLKLEGCRICG